MSSRRFIPIKSKLHRNIASRDVCRRDEICRPDDIILTRQDELSRRDHEYLLVGKTFKKANIAGTASISLRDIL